MSHALPARADRSSAIDQLLARIQAEPIRPIVADNALFPPAYIEDGRDLDRALGSMGLKRGRKPSKRRITGAILGMWGLSILTLAGALIVVLGLVMWVAATLSAMGGGR